MGFQGDNPFFREIKQSFPVTFSQYSCELPFQSYPISKQTQQLRINSLKKTMQSFHLLHSVLFFGLIGVAFVNNFISWLIMSRFNKSSGNSNEEIWLLCSARRLVLCGENTLGPAKRWTFNTEQTHPSSAAAAMKTPGFLTHWLPDSQRVDSQHTMASIHHCYDSPINVSLPSQNVSTNWRISRQNFPPQTQTRRCERCKSLSCSKIHLPWILLPFLLGELPH